MKSISRKGYIWITAIFFVIIIADAYIHSRLINSGVWIDHFLQTVAAIAAAIVIILAFTRNLGTAVLLLLFYASVRWLLFDIALNHFRNLPLDYIGIKDKDDALLDDLLLNFPDLQYIFKTLLIVISIFLLVKFRRK